MILFFSFHNKKFPPMYRTLYFLRLCIRLRLGRCVRLRVCDLCVVLVGFCIFRVIIAYVYDIFCRYLKTFENCRSFMCFFDLLFLFVDFSLLCGVLGFRFTFSLCYFLRGGAHVQRHDRSPSHTPSTLPNKMRRGRVVLFAL
jgi:hypothetical protein